MCAGNIIDVKRFCVFIFTKTRFDVFTFSTFYYKKVNKTIQTYLQIVKETLKVLHILLQCSLVVI